MSETLIAVLVLVAITLAPIVPAFILYRFIEAKSTAAADGAKSDLWIRVRGAGVRSKASSDHVQISNHDAVRVGRQSVHGHADGGASPDAHASVGGDQMTRRNFLTKALLVSVLSTGLTSAQQTTVRGRLFRRGPRGEQYYATNIGVRLTHPRYGPSSMSYTDYRGMYYLTAPPGDYTLEIWLSKDQVMRFTIRALPQEFTDIAPI